MCSVRGRFLASGGTVSLSSTYSTDSARLKTLKGPCTYTSLDNASNAREEQRPTQRDRLPNSARASCRIHVSDIRVDGLMPHTPVHGLQKRVPQLHGCQQRDQEVDGGIDRCFRCQPDFNRSIGSCLANEPPWTYSIFIWTEGG